MSNKARVAVSALALIASGCGGVEATLADAGVVVDAGLGDVQLGDVHATPLWSSVPSPTANDLYGLGRTPMPSGFYVVGDDAAYRAFVDADQQVQWYEITTAVPKPFTLRAVAADGYQGDPGFTQLVVAVGSDATGGIVLSDVSKGVLQEAQPIAGRSSRYYGVSLELEPLFRRNTIIGGKGPAGFLRQLGTIAQPAAADYFALYGDFAVGDGMVARDVSGAWEETPLPGVHYGVSRFWIVGAGGEIIRRSGNTFVRLGSPTREDLHGVAETPSGTYIVGARGTVVFIGDDGTPTLEPSGTQSDLNAILFDYDTPKGRVWVVGSGGTILRRSLL